MSDAPLRPIVIGLLLASAMALPMAGLAQSTSSDPSMPQQVKPDNRLTRNVSGKVGSKTDNTLTVEGRTITLTSATTFSKGGTAIGSSDVRVGDMVNIVTSDDGQVAVSVNVTASS
ncbi:MAG: hypothetical protein ABI222_13150 [Opitutaceae bacterium]